MSKEFMRWDAISEKQGWYNLSLGDRATFQRFMEDILSRRDNHGIVYIYDEKATEDDAYMSITYGYGAITWFSDDRVNRIDNATITKAKANGFPTHIDYYIWIKDSRR